MHVLVNSIDELCGSEVNKSKLVKSRKCTVLHASDSILKIFGEKSHVYAKLKKLFNPIYAINIHCVLPLATKLNIQQECSHERLHHHRFCSPLKASLRFPIFKTIDGQLLGSMRVF